MLAKPDQNLLQNYPIWGNHEPIVKEYGTFIIFVLLQMECVQFLYLM